MGTLVSIRVVTDQSPEIDDTIARAFGWFHEVEARCSRFDPQSELMQLSVGVATPVSAIVFEATQFALSLAAETAGAFDPTVGQTMQKHGYNRHHLTGSVLETNSSTDGETRFEDVQLDPRKQSILLRRPLTLDLGAVAKGMAVDLAARELAPLRDFAIDAGGDLYLGGKNEKGEAWLVGIRHPFEADEMLTSVRATDQAICTSGDYERGPHILDARTGEAAKALASSTVIAPNAMLADALATAAFVLGPDEGLALLERMGVEGFLLTAAGERRQTEGWRDAA